TANTARGGSAGGAGAEAGDGLGGAIFSRNGSVTLINVTISANTAAQGGRGVYIVGQDATATAVLINTILGQADNSASDFRHPPRPRGSPRTPRRARAPPRQPQNPGAQQPPRRRPQPQRHRAAGRPPAGGPGRQRRPHPDHGPLARLPSPQSRRRPRRLPPG